ncbi:MAG: type II toxin-antitoxin system RelE/ParE family toxin [Actinomycetota bacterium]|jgi:hypothetical protein|nr:type II toxin-antitoxin system RelE/ParE family toxin [Actinomycetota bacterium]
MSWGVVTTDDFDVWLYGLSEDQQAAVVARVDMLATSGPTLGRPTVDSIKGSRHHNMKELRCSKGGALRVLFIFDPLRQAVMLLGGDKSEDSQWERWYAGAVPRADSLYDDHLAQLREEGLIK